MRQLRSSWRLLFCLVLLCCCLAGCGQTTEQPQAEAVPEGVIVDSVGRQVELSEAPQRVAALDSFAGEAMVMIGAGEKMVAAPNGVRQDVILQEIYPGLTEVGVPMSGGTINAESLLALQPDLILLKGAMYANTDEVAKIEQLGIPYLVVEYSNMAEQIAALDMIGKALGGEAEQKAQQISAYYQDVIDRASAIADTIPERKKLSVYHSINELVRTDGTDTLGYDWITCVGAINVSGEGELSFAEDDYFAGEEQIFLWDPDVIICNEADTAEYLLTEERWSGLRAVREGEVYNIPVGATRWGQRGSLETFFAILWLGTTIYPEYYGEIDLKQEVFDFYQQVLGITLDDATYEKMLSGKGLRKSSSSAGM